MGKRTGVVRLHLAVSVAAHSGRGGRAVVLPLHGAKATDGKGTNGIFRLPFAPFEQAGTHADSELVDTDTHQLRHDKVAKLMHQNQQVQHQ